MASDLWSEIGRSERMTDANWDGFLNLRIGITIYPSHERALEGVLTDFVQRCPAQFVLLADVSGQVIAVRGERGTTDLVALASLIAGDLAASQEIARITGQYQSCQLILREGTRSVSLISEAGRYLVLFVQIAADVPLGWARLLTRDASKKLGEIVAVPPEEVQKVNLGIANEEISGIVDDALDSMWTG